MGLFDFLFGRRGRDSAGAEPAAMRPGNPSWVLVEGSTPDDIRSAVIEHSGLTKPEQPDRHRVSILALGAGRYGVLFDPPAPPYALTNLIGWLGDPRMTLGARRAVGWLVSPGTGVRYFLACPAGNTGGDTLIGVGSDGRQVSVFLPDCSLSPCKERVEAVPEPELPAGGAAPVSSFEVTLDGDTSFGNPRFVVG